MFSLFQKKKIDSENFIMKLEEACVHIKISMQEKRERNIDLIILYFLVWEY